MKALVLAVSVFCSLVGVNSYATGANVIHKELDEALKFENNTLAIEKNKTEFVKVSFQINQEGKVKVLASNYSDEQIKKQLMEKLSEITIETTHDTSEVYHYNFTFKKM